MILDKEHIMIKRLALKLRHLPKCTVFDILLKTEILFNSIETPITKDAIDHLLFKWEYPRAITIPDGGHGILIDTNQYISIYRKVSPKLHPFSLSGNPHFFKVSHNKKVLPLNSQNLKIAFKRTSIEPVIKYFLKKHSNNLMVKNKLTGQYLLIEILSQK